MIQSCTDLYGATSPDDCVQLTKALQAVEMDQASRCSGNPGMKPACTLPELDECPGSTIKTKPGFCGCDMTDVDDDQDERVYCQGRLGAQDDCDDSDWTVYPGAIELFDGKDNDCDGAVDEDTLANGDQDGDGYTAKTASYGSKDDCDDSNPAVHPGAVEVCNNIDDDCNHEADDSVVFPKARCGIEVNDTVVPGKMVCTTTGEVACSTNGPDEVCDGYDNDYDGQFDEGFNIAVSCVAGQGSCQAFGVYVCDGLNASRCDATPGTPSAEVCDDLDNDCDGEVDEGFGLGNACSVGTGACQAAGALVCKADGTGAECDATEGTPTAEICDGIDNDCDGIVDNDGDADGDGVYNCTDFCPTDSSKIAPGQCGCNVADTDSDGDGTADCNDQCAADLNKIEPGVCGCGVPDDDTNGDGVIDCPGQSVTLNGTDGNDTITVVTGPELHTVRINSGPLETFSAALVREIHIEGLLGRDTITINGSSTNDRATLGDGEVHLSASSYDIYGTGLEYVTILAGSAVGSQAELTGSIGSNRLYSYPGYTLLSDSPRTIYYRLEGFGALSVSVPMGGRNYAFMYGSAEADHLTGDPDQTVFDRSGDGTDVTASGFSRVYSYGSGGDDSAELTGSGAYTGRFYSYPTYSLMTDTRRNYYFYVNGFSRVVSTVTGEGNQYAYLHDSPGNDTLTATAQGVTMERTEPPSSVTISGYSRVYGYATSGGVDTATLTGSDIGNRFTGYPAYSTYYDLSRTFYHYLRGFDRVTAVGSSNSAVRDYAYLYDSTGDDLFYGKGSLGYMEDKVQQLYHNEITGFEYVYARSSDKNTDDDIVLDGGVDYNLIRSGSW